MKSPGVDIGQPFANGGDPALSLPALPPACQSLVRRTGSGRQVRDDVGYVMLFLVPGFKFRHASAKAGIS